MKKIFGTVLALGALTSTYVYAAGTLQGQLGVQMTIGAGCTVTNGSSDGTTNTFGNINFGEYPSLNSTVDGRSFGTGGGSSFGLQCTTGTNYTVALDEGANPQGTQRRMANNGNFITYNLYQDAGRTVPWGAGTSALAGVGDGNNQEVVVFARVPAQTTPAAGTYLDTVQVTVSW
jgi:spore coat protein U-like protein